MNKGPTRYQWGQEPGFADTDGVLILTTASHWVSDSVALFPLLEKEADGAYA